MSYPGGYPGQQPAAGGYPGQQTPGGGYPGAYATAPAYGGAPQQPGQNPYQPGAPYQPQPGAPYQPQPQPGAPYQPQQPYQPRPQQPYQGAPAGAQPYGAPPGNAAGVSPEVMSWFRAVDQDNSGYINASELSRALQSGNNRNFSLAACETMMGLFSQGNTGRINAQQFSQLFAFINQWTEAFRRADRDNSGSISVQELSQVLKEQGYNIGPTTVQTMVNKYGAAAPAPSYPGAYAGAPQSASSLGLDGFILVNVQLKRLTDVFRQRDTAQQGRINVSYEEFIGMIVNIL